MIDYYNNLKECIDCCSSFVKRHKVNDVCFSLQLCRIDEDSVKLGFQNKKFYDKVKSIFDGCEYLHKDVLCHDHDLANEDDIIDTMTFSYKHTPYDFRLIVYKKTSIDTKIDVNRYIIKNNYLHMVHYQTPYNTDDLYRFDVVIKFIERVSVRYTIHDALLKIRDVINICEPIQTEILQVIN